ncbi:unnamed protein product, partial [Scytosiphon promiscuus]
SVQTCRRQCRSASRLRRQEPGAAMVRSRLPSWRDSTDGKLGSATTSSGSSGAQHVAKSASSAPAPALTLDRVIGQTCMHNTALAVNPITGDVAYPAGCVVVIYQPRRNKQFSRYLRASKTVSCLAFSRDGGMLVVGERGHQPSATVWSLATGAVIRELAGGHRFGIGCIAFTPSGGGVVTMGFKHDRMLRVWDLRLTAETTREISPDGSSDRSAPVVPGYPSSDPDSPPPPPPPPYPPDDGQAAGAPGVETAAAAPTRENCAVQVVRIPQRVRSMSFTPDGECLVTCGDGHVKFWKMAGGIGHIRPGRTVGRKRLAGGGFLGIGAGAAPPNPIARGTTTGKTSPRSAKAGAGVPVRRGRGNEVEEVAGVDKQAVCTLEGWAATIPDEFKGATFVDVSSSGRIGKGVLCAFTRGGVMEHWVSLEAPAAYGLSVHEDGTLAAACADGIVRLFDAKTLRYLQEIADLSARAATAAGTTTKVPADARSSPRDTPPAAPEDSDEVNVGTVGKDALDQRLADKAGGSGGSCSDVAGGEGRAAIRYPATVGCRLSPCGTKVVCIYADRGFFIWDVKDPLCVGKYRSFLAHGGCIWDVQRMPETSPAEQGARSSPTPPLPDIPEGAMVTCSADNTVRIWDLGALDGTGTGNSKDASHSGRWSNIYSKHLLRVLYGGRKNASVDAKGSSPGKGAGEEESRYRSGKFGRTLGGLDSDHSGNEAAGEEASLSEGGFDPEAPRKPEWSCAPRSLAVHPDGSEVACGDKGGRIRVYSLTEMELAHTQSAHDAEVLSLAYSPIMIPATGGGGGIGKPLRSVPDSSTAGGTDVRGTAGGRADTGAGDCGSRTVAGMVGSWEAVDPLDPPGTAQKMLSLSLATSLSSSVSAGQEMIAVGSSRGGAGGSVAGRGDESYIVGERDGRGGQGCQGVSRKSEEQRAGGSGKGVAGGDGDSGGDLARPKAPTGSRQSAGRLDCRPLVLLASASRDRLVHVFDASRHPHPCDEGGRHGGDPVVAAAAKIASESGGTSGLREKGDGAAAAGAGKKAAAAARDGASGRVGVTAAGYPLLKTLDSHTGSVTAVKFSKDGKRLITAGGDKLLVLNTVRGPHVNRLRAVSVPQGTIFGLDVDPTNKYIVTAGQDKRLNIWSTTSGKHVRAYKVEQSAAAPPAKPPPADSSTVSTAEGAGVPSTGRGGAEKGEAGGELFKVDLDPTGMYAAACSFDKVRVCAVYTG